MANEDATYDFNFNSILFLILVFTLGTLAKDMLNFS